ncbi:unnamed protein product [Allacma fusca]|uniref:Uncharacterized protein n=1 Tax=Allacma fusca TaxID=39272 RepID=A0A8J2J5G4_9HEXA|nr:unnamed protein product [Allacma fusca]
MNRFCSLTNLLSKPNQIFGTTIFWTLFLFFPKGILKTLQSKGGFLHVMYCVDLLEGIYDNKHFCLYVFTVPIDFYTPINFVCVYGYCNLVRHESDYGIYSSLQHKLWFPM